MDNLIENVDKHLLSWDWEVEQKLSVVPTSSGVSTTHELLISIEVIRTFSEVSVI